MQAGKASRTAQQNALFRAIEAAKRPADRISHDTLARRFLPLEFRVLAEAARIAPVRRVIEGVIDWQWPGPRAGQIVRTAFIDELVQKAAADVEQVLFLGAGLDSRAFRLPELDAIGVFEVDHPATQTMKRRVVQDKPNVTFVAVDFMRDALDDALLRAGFARDAVTLVLWEGVTNYLTAEAVDATFRTIASLVGSRSPVAFTYIDSGLLDGSGTFEGAAESSRAVDRVGEPYTFGFRPSEVPSYLRERGFDVTMDEPVSALASRYYGDRTPKVYSYYHVVTAQKV